MQLFFKLTSELPLPTTHPQMSFSVSQPLNSLGQEGDAHFTPLISPAAHILGHPELPHSSGECWPILYEVMGLSLPVFPGTSLTLLFCSENTQNRNHLKSPAL